MKFKILHIVFVLLPYFLNAQLNVKEIGKMPPDLLENSGLIFYKDKLVCHNDSGNTPQLFEVDTVSMQITRRVTISNATNIDWEDIAQDENYIYIGDIGNYSGTRDNLVIYKIAKIDYDQSEEVNAEIINFNYGDQDEYLDNGKSNWDAEALFVLNDQLIVLSKQWLDLGTVAYSIPKIPGDYSATRLDAYNVNGLLTGATYNPINNELLVLGYSELLVPFVVKVEGATQNAIFEGKVERISMEIGFAQAEGITYFSENQYFVSSEFFESVNPAITLDPLLYKLQFNHNTAEENEVDPPIEESEPNPEDEGDKLVLYRNFDSNILEYKLNVEKPIMAQAIFDTTGRMVNYRLGSEIQNNEVDLSSFKSSIYFLTFYLGDSVISKPFVQN